MPPQNQQPSPAGPPGETEQPAPAPSRSLMFWWVVLAALLLWNLFTLWGKTTAEQAAEIPYTTFLEQVRAGNVAEISLQGENIKGKFERAIVWPPPKEKASGAAVGQTAVAKAGHQVGGATAASSPAPAATEKVMAATATAPAATAAPSAASGTGAGGTPESPKKKTPAQRYALFETVFPEAIGDASLMPLLEAHQVQVSAQPPQSHWLMNLMIEGLPLLLLVGLFVYMGRRAAQAQGGGILGFGRTKARRYVGEQTRVTFEDVAGEDEAKSELQEEVDFLRSPDKYHAIGARIPRGVLLVGPPGTGKTLLARAVAGEANAPFFSISASEFVEMFVGVGASRVRDLFVQAKASAPAIIFIDELDAVGRRRGAGVGTVNDEREQTLNQLLVEMDGFDERQEVILIAATNRPDVLDPALLRPGRFDRQVIVGLPDQKGREGILRIHSRGLQMQSDVDLDVIARSTTGMSGADLANLCNEAALIAARKSRVRVAMTDFEEAVDKLLLGQVRPLVLDDHDRRAVAYHESGHTLVAWLIPSADPVHKVSIIPRGRSLGVTEQLPDGDRYNYGRNYLMARLAVMLGGRVAEEIALDDISTGAESDLVQATRLARRMVTRWGMGSLGLVAFEADEEQPFLGYQLAQGRDYSEATAARVDADVEQLLKDSHETVRDLLTGARDQLDRLSQLLFEKETIDRQELEQVLGRRAGDSQARDGGVAADTEENGT
jgi:cell division protease FtsH